MNQEQAKELIAHLLFAAQKAKSDMAEALAGHRELDGVELRVLKLIHPDLFDEDRLQLVSALYQYAQKEVLEPMDVYNALFLCQRNMAVTMCYQIIFDQELPDARASMLDMMKESPQ